MGNIIRLNSTQPKEEWLSMSNQGTDCFLELLILGASMKEMTGNQKNLIGYLRGRRHENDAAPGTVSFDIDEMPWDPHSLREDVRFLTEVIKNAKDPGTWKELDYEPNAEIVIPWLGQFEDMVNRFPNKCCNEELQLYIPRPEDGWFYVKMLSDPATMAYNAPWFPPDGCIPNAEEEWLALQESYIGKEPERFYAFLQRVSDGSFVGDVNYHRSHDHDWWDMGIVIYAPERAKGYGKKGLRLLLDRAFRIDGISCLHNDFETTRGAAYRIHKEAGFREAGIEDGIIHLQLTRDEYLNNITGTDEIKADE